jgi:hypothetical protein
MVFVPMVPPQRPPSARALDLGRRLKAEVEKFEAQYPGTSRDDLRAAAGIAIGEAAGRGPGRRQVRAVAAGVAGAIVALGFIMQAATSAGSAEGTGPVVAVAVGLASIGIIVAAVLIKRARG